MFITKILSNFISINTLYFIFLSLTLHRSANIRNGRTREYWSVEEGKTAEIDGDNDNVRFCFYFFLSSNTN